MEICMLLAFLLIHPLHPLPTPTVPAGGSARISVTLHLPGRKAFQVVPGASRPVAQALEACADHGGAHTGVVVHRRSIVGGLHELVKQRSADLLVVGAYHHSHGMSHTSPSAPVTKKARRQSPS